MNSFKLMLRLTGILAALALAATPLTALAQTPPSQTQTPQNQQNRPPRIELSPEQQAEFEKIQKEVINNINGVLTPEQRTQFAAGRQNGQGFGAVQNLSDAQKSQIQQLLVNFNTRIGGLLTQQQRQEIEQYQRSQQTQPNQPNQPNQR